ncbi:hypothetical protein COEREDRAFT_6180 [Coemansia reversa NRRL 1564]|uniref:Uncharacterized protein n=1 Tax=Coemansia reversa (strain ATCC 12441 / NRRL 1564) TaxID=763665 RepID=A0A2G5BJ20_COERN|nr:hypothetical protein COEREDRAFT_6180 [Coemansia reversa NRRL 1564]|eukprot:PIA19020.1 hypothetical protein COEREDRAFT_6180 [Coemansia reversa NRRL 1564]
MANRSSGGTHSGKRRGGRRGRARSVVGRGGMGTVSAGLEKEGDEQRRKATEVEQHMQAAVPGADAGADSGASRLGQMVFTVGTFDEDDGGGMELAAQGQASGLPANAAARQAQTQVQQPQPQHSEPQAQRQTLFTMGSHSEMSETPAGDSDSGAVSADEQSPALHACRATTSLAQMGQAPRGRGRVLPRDSHAKARKRLPSRPHAKKTASSAALRSRMAARGMRGRVGHAPGSIGDSSYVDASDGSDDIEEGVSVDEAMIDPADGPADETSDDPADDPIDSPAPQSSLCPAAAPRGSPHSSTATLGAAGSPSDSATTASTGSLRVEAPHSVPGPSVAPRSFISRSAKRHMESQRQQSIVEKEEEDMDITCALLTGVPRRRNRPAGTAPQAFLAPDSPAYMQHMRRSERGYSHARALAHPLLESIARCADLREQRRAAAAREPPPWAARRARSTAWWDALMPPAAARDPPRAPPGLQHAELPRWVLPPDPAKCAVYADPRSPSRADPSCPHVHELRARAADLRFMRQHALPAVRRTDAADLWRTRRLPVLNSAALLPVTEPAPEPAEATIRPNHIAAPFRRAGSVYGCAALATPSASASITESVHSAAVVRRLDAAPAARPHSVAVFDNDSRRSYFERLSVDDDRPSVAAASPAPSIGLLRRVISGLTGTTALGSPQ